MVHNIRIKCKRFSREQGSVLSKEPKIFKINPKKTYLILIIKNSYF